jgi:hypothetical protein
MAAPYAPAAVATVKHRRKHSGIARRMPHYLIRMEGCN